ncbi:hypothetical protein [Rhizobium leguminosarum]|uniref:hypothetical protein n=1 Tax=Rhizobium leguminosarum TaxID=384 RepID=UPI00143F7636|nr:hypothetical protein [Rhizobium leguminosarum]
MIANPNSLGASKVQIRIATLSAFSDLSIADAVADPLIALVNEADCICDRAFAQLLESASRVLFVGAAREVLDIEGASFPQLSASERGHLRASGSEPTDTEIAPGSTGSVDGYQSPTDEYGPLKNLVDNRLLRSP